MQKLFSAAVLMALGAAHSAAQQPRVEVLVLGAYHMANPGRDIVNMQADDVLSPKRQAEMTALIETLKRFRPTKIAVERDPEDARLKKDYGDYLAGTRALTRNEIEQVGYRLAKELGHSAVYGVDADGEFQYGRIAKFAKATGRMAEWDSIETDVRAMVKAESDFLQSHTILEMLQRMNSDEAAQYSVGLYYRQAHFGEAWDWAGADFLTEWFRRNARIYSNIIQLAQPGDRVLVLFGAGHLGWLRQDLSNDPTVRLRKLGEFVR